MSSERFTDELLSAIIDGQADEATVAAANADPMASHRLQAMRTAAGFVAEEPPPATPARRQQSIAAALAVATPAPEVTSLTTKREAKRKATWERSGPNPALIAVAAALLLFVVVGVASLRGGGDQTTSVAGSAADAVDDGSSLGAEAADAVAEDAGDDEAMEEEAMEEEEEAMEDDGSFFEDPVPEAAEDSADEDERDVATADDDETVDEEEAFAPETAAPQQELTLNELLAQDPPALPSTNSIDGINDLISLGSITGQFSIDDILGAGTNPDCLADSSETSTFGAAFIDPDGLEFPRLVIIEFGADGTTPVFDASDCSVPG